MQDILTYVVTSIVGLWLGSVEIRLRNQNKDISQKPDRTEVDYLINIKSEATKLEVREVRDDIKRLEAKIDALVDAILKKS